MKKIFMMLSAIVFLAMPCSQMFAASVPIPLGAGYGDVTEGQEGPQRGPVIVPELSIEWWNIQNNWNNIHVWNIKNKGLRKWSVNNRWWFPE